VRLDGGVTKSEPAERPGPSDRPDRPDRQLQILDAVLAVLARDGIAGVSVRAVAKEAGVASGLAGYYFDGKAGMVESALHRIGEQDVELVAARPGTDPETAVRQALKRVASPRFLTTEYVTLRLQLWALARVDPALAQINTAAHDRYRDALAQLIAAARPRLSRSEVTRRATDIALIQNGIWLTSLLGVDREAVNRAVSRCEELALGS
jgi:TetR/AcrR family transcriptional regulator, cholesterol catabolism regulator